MCGGGDSTALGHTEQRPGTCTHLLTCRICSEGGGKVTAERAEGVR